MNSLRGELYVDGFNLYHAVYDLGKPYLKWLNLRRLAELIARGHAKTIGEVVFCTAYFPGDHGKKVRHQAYVAALAMVDVDTRFGHTTKEPMQCRLNGCGHKWDQPREKETDINLSLAMTLGAFDDKYDVAFLLTADTDQAATLRVMRARFPKKRLITVCPPGRPPSKHLKDLSHSTFKLTEDHIDECVLPALVTKPGSRTIARPREYAPPAGWVHPDERPKK